MTTFSGNETAEFRIAAQPDRLIMVVPRLSGRRARSVANEAVRITRTLMPKLTGQAYSRIFPLYGAGYFGVGFLDNYLWFQENGIRPFTMVALAGKTIPMWVNDPTGTEHQRNPKAPTRVTMSGIPQVLIFRRVARIGQTRVVRTGSKTSGEVTERTVPMSYPGAPGRIGKREAGQPLTTPGRSGGAIAQGNVGVRWRHPGLQPRKFMNHAITLAAQQGGILPVRIYAADRHWRSHF
jgi:hypothetical protein